MARAKRVCVGGSDNRRCDSQKCESPARFVPPTLAIATAWRDVAGTGSSHWVWSGNAPKTGRKKGEASSPGAFQRSAGANASSI